MNLEEILKSLPNLEDNESFTVVTQEDEGYTPNLYKYEGEWHLDWVSIEEGDSLLDFIGNSPIEAARKAYNYCKENKFIK